MIYELHEFYIRKGPFYHCITFQSFGLASWSYPGILGYYGLYGQSKLSQILITREQNARYDNINAYRSIPDIKLSPIFF